MLIQISRLIGLPIVSSETGSKAAVLQLPLIDPADGQLLAWQTKASGFFGKTKFLSNNDIIEYGKEAALISSAESLVEQGEIIRIQKILRERVKILGATAYTESGKILGRIHDLLINLELGRVVKFYIKGLFKDKIIPSDRVIKIENKGVIFQEDIETVPEGVGAMA